MELPSDLGPGLRGRRSECEAIDRLLDAALAGRSEVLVPRGEAGIGKTALLEFLLERASDCRIARAPGVESEMELAFAGLQQLCAPMLDRLGRLPGATATEARRDGEEYVLDFEDRGELRGDRLLVATGRRPRVWGIGLETVGIEADGDGIAVDAHLRAGDRLWAIGDVTGIWPLTHVGHYQGDVVAANILGGAREANYEAVPLVVYTDPQAASVGAADARFSATAPVAEVPKTATYTRAYADDNGFLTLLSDGERLIGAYAVGPEAGDGCNRPPSRSAPASHWTC